MQHLVLSRAFDFGYQSPGNRVVGFVQQIEQTERKMGEVERTKPDPESSSRTRYSRESETLSPVKKDNAIVSELACEKLKG